MDTNIENNTEQLSNKQAVNFILAHVVGFLAIVSLITHAELTSDTKLESFLKAVPLSVMGAFAGAGVAVMAGYKLTNNFENAAQHKKKLIAGTTLAAILGAHLTIFRVNMAKEPSEQPQSSAPTEQLEQSAAPQEDLSL